MMFQAIFLLLLACFTLASTIPLSPTDYAFSRGFAGSNVKVDMYIDLACSDTQAVWSTLNEVFDAYNDKVSFHVHVFPLPYHTWAFLASKSAHIVDSYGQDGEVWAFMDKCFADQSAMLNKLSYHKTYEMMTRMMSEWVQDSSSVSEEDFEKGMASQTIEMNTRYMFKYATLHNIYGTPLYMINGVQDDSLETFEDWSSTLDALLQN